MYKKQISLLLILFLIALFSYSEELTINRIKFLGNTLTGEAVLKTFTMELKEGMKIDSGVLESTALRIEERLATTTWFYSAKVYVVPLSSDETSVNVVVEVQEGFLYRFWGGPIYGGFGIDNLWGSGRFFGFDVGYNRQFVYFNDERLGLGGLVYETGLGNKAVNYFEPDGDKVTLQNIGFSLFGGVNLPFDIRTGVYVDGGWLLSDGYEYRDYSIFPRYDFRLNSRNDIFSPGKGVFLDATGGYIYPQGIVRGALDSRVYFPLFVNELRVASRLGLSAQTANRSGEYFDLSLAGINGLRKPFEASMLGNAFVQWNTEIRFLFLNSFVFDFMELSIEPAFFFDLGCASDDIASIPSGNWQFGYGPALRIYFGAPVFVPVRLELGFDKNGASSFFFSVESPY